jgi:hypothetical protein
MACVLLLLPHELLPEDALRCVDVMGTTAERHPLDLRLASQRHGVEMIELKEVACRAALTRGAHEAALTTVAGPYRALHRRRDEPSPRRRDLAPLARALGRREAPLLELGDAELDDTGEHLGEIPGRNLVAEQGLGVAEQVVGGLPDRHLEREALGRERRQLRSRGLDRCEAFLRGARRDRLLMWCFRERNRLASRLVGPGKPCVVNTPRGVFGSGDARSDRCCERLHPRRQVRPREALQELLDLGFGLVLGGLQQRASGLLGEVGSQQDDGAQVQAAIGERREDRRESPGGSGGVDALVGRILGEPQLLQAEDKHRRETGRHVEAPGVDLGDVGEEGRGGGAFLDGELAEVPKQDMVARWDNE